MVFWILLTLAGFLFIKTFKDFCMNDCLSCFSLSHKKMHKNPPLLRWSIGLAVVVLLTSGCALQQRPPEQVSAAMPAAWQSALPHGGQPGAVADWWQSAVPVAEGPLLAELVAAAQAVSPSVAAARSRIAQARAAQTSAGAALLPSLSGNASASRSRSQIVASGGAGDGSSGASAPIAGTLQAGVQAQWEIDLFGGNAAAQNASTARLLGADALWHEARVSVAAETAGLYNRLRTCRQQAALSAADATSRSETARLSALSTRAGFTAPALDALARASAADARNRSIRQRTVCELDMQALTALTGLDSAVLRQKVAATPEIPAQAAMLSIANDSRFLAFPNVPAEALAQRPDIYSAARDVAAASFDVGSADAARYPRLSLNGSIGALRIAAGGAAASTATWSIGPLALSVPIFDGGRSKANLQAAQARYDEAAAAYRARVRGAVREVEEALLNLQTSAAQASDAQTAAAGYTAAFTGTEARYKNGLASLVELEDARRTQLAAREALVLLAAERTAAWIALYRAVGGGWAAPAP